MKYNVTNVSAQSDKVGRNVFLTEAGKLLKPGMSTPCNRVDPGTRALADQGVLKIDEGDFTPPPLFPDKKKVVEEDETPTVTSAEDVAARKAEAAAMDKRIAADKAAADAKSSKGSHEFKKEESDKDHSDKKSHGSK